MEIKEMLLSEEFRSYHKRQAQEIAGCLFELVKDNAEPARLAGALDMARRLQGMPLKLYEDKNFNAAVTQHLKADYAEITTALVRKYLEQ